MPQNSLIIGVDLAPIKPIPKVITFQSDITTEKCRATIRTHLKTWKADCVLHDGAPNVGTAWVQDSFNQAELVLHSLKLATEFLIEGGTFVTKVFRSKDYNPLLWVFNQLFTKVEATKPPSSRNVSAEIFVVCRGFKAPKRIDPRLLDPRTVFEDLAAPTPNNEAKVFNPEIKKRKREGYEDGEYIQFKEISASEFINTTDQIAILGQYNKLSFEQPKNGDVALAALDKLPETTDEVRTCCADLKVLGRKEFKLLLKWRLKVREIFGFQTKKSAKEALEQEVAEVEPMDEELQIQEELQKMKEKESAKKKRERRKDNEKKTKDIIRMQMNMTAPMDIGMEQEGPKGEGAIFRLKTLDKTVALNKIAKGKMAILTEAEQRKEFDSGIGSESDEETDEELDRLERELDGLYDNYKERKAASDAKWRAKKARQENSDDDEWEGVSADEKQDSDDEILEEDSSDESDEEMEEDSGTPLIRDLDDTPADENGLSRRAQRFFSSGVFAEIPGLLDGSEESEEDEEEVVEKAAPAKEKQSKKEKTPAKSKKEEKAKDDGDFEVVKSKEIDSDDDWEETEKKKKKKDGRPSKHPPFSDTKIKRISTLTSPFRHRDHHGRGHDAGPSAGDGREDEVRSDGRRVQQVRLQGPGWPARLVHRRRAQARQAAQAHHQGGRAGHQGEAAGVQRAADQEGGRGARAQEVQAGPEAREAQEEGRYARRRGGHVGEGEGEQHRQAHVVGQPRQEEAADQGDQGGRHQQGYFRQAEGRQGPVQDGGPAHEEGDEGAQEDSEEEVDEDGLSSGEEGKGKGGGGCQFQHVAYFTIRDIIGRVLLLSKYCWFFFLYVAHICIKYHTMPVLVSYIGVLSTGCFCCSVLLDVDRSNKVGHWV